MKKPTIENCRIFTAETDDDNYNVLVREDDGYYYFYQSQNLTDNFRYADCVKIEDVDDVKKFIDDNIAGWIIFN